MKHNDFSTKVKNFLKENRKNGVVNTKVVEITNEHSCVVEFINEIVDYKSWLIELLEDSKYKTKEIRDDAEDPFSFVVYEEQEFDTTKTIEINVFKTNLEIRLNIDNALHQISYAKEEAENKHKHGVSHVARKMNEYVEKAKEYYYYAFGKANTLGDTNITKENFEDLRKLYNELRC